MQKQKKCLLTRKQVVEKVLRDFVRDSYNPPVDIEYEMCAKKICELFVDAEGNL